MKYTCFKTFAAAACIFTAATVSLAADSTLSVVFAKPASGTAFCLAEGQKPATVYVDPGDSPAVLRAAGDFVADIGRVTGKDAELRKEVSGLSGRPVIVGTIGQSKLIDQLVSSSKLDVKGVKGAWESHIVQIIDKPMAGVDQALVIAGSDRRGTIYGMYGISEKIGVSPWYYFADVPAKKHNALYITSRRYVQPSPKVKYRGIFINDEEPAFGGWARANFGGINSKMYVHVFELILRLRGNYMWPAMWGKAFNEDDPQNPVLADQYGIVMGTSHHEPMIRAQEEYTKRKGRIGAWNYGTNAANLREFWKEGVTRNMKYENVITVGMRGDGDEAMNNNGHMEDNIKLLKQIVDDQRKLIAEAAGKPADQVPQMWAVYKEVQDYYDAGMRVPDDVTIMWCDDNWGNIRHVPSKEDLKRSGGAGMYYHVDYVGGPRSYRWLNVTPLTKIREQMNYAYRYGIDRLWILNTGDLKPMEVPIEFFLTFAWDPDAISAEQIQSYTRACAARDFGEEYADEIAYLISKYTKYNAWRKPECTGTNTFSVSSYREAEFVLAAWNDLVKRSETLRKKLPADAQDAYYQLVHHPVKACANLVEMYIAAGRNALYREQGRSAANYFADLTELCFKDDKAYNNYYNTKIANGKWAHMMDQTHIGYTSWDAPRADTQPRVSRITPVEGAAMGVAVENERKAAVAANESVALGKLRVAGEKTSFEVFSRGTKDFQFTVKNVPAWLKLSATSGTVPAEGSVLIEATLQPGTAKGALTAAMQVVAADGTSMTVNASADPVAVPANASKAVAVVANPVNIPASKFSAKTAVNGVEWKIEPDFGRADAAMAVEPVTADSVLPPAKAPELQYQVYFAEDGEYELDVQTGPTLNFVAGRGVRLGVAIDNGEVQSLDPFTAKRLSVKNLDYNGDWSAEVQDNLRHLKSKHKVAAGLHTVRVVMIDPAVSVERIQIYPAGQRLPQSYFGPGFFAADRK